MTEQLTKHQLEIISAVAIQEYEKRQKKAEQEERDKRLRNTELLLKNYRKLKEHCLEVQKENEEDMELLEIIKDNKLDEISIDSENFNVESLSKYHVKTAKMLRHIDKMLNNYEFDCNNGTEEEQRRFKVLKMRYIGEQRFTVRDICEYLNIEQGSVYRDTKLSVKDFSVLLFGIDAIEFK